VEKTRVFKHEEQYKGDEGGFLFVIGFSRDAACRSFTSGAKEMVLQQQWRHALRKYVLFQLPELGAVILLLAVLETWVDLPGWVLWAAPAGWIIKDILLFPFVWRAYLPPPSEDNRLIGETGISRQRLDPKGYIFVRGELWKAELEKGQSTQPVEEGELVTVVGKDGLTLLVRRARNTIG